MILYKRQNKGWNFPVILWCIFAWPVWTFDVILLFFCPRVYHHNHINGIARYKITCVAKKVYTAHTFMSCTTTNIKRIHCICIAIYKGKWTLTMLCLLPYFKRESMRKFVYLLEIVQVVSQYSILIWQDIKTNGVISIK